MVNSRGAGRLLLIMVLRTEPTAVIDASAILPLLAGLVPNRLFNRSSVVRRSWLCAMGPAFRIV